MWQPTSRRSRSLKRTNSRRATRRRNKQQRDDETNNSNDERGQSSRRAKTAGPTVPRGQRPRLAASGRPGPRGQQCGRNGRNAERYAKRHGRATISDLGAEVARLLYCGLRLRESAGDARVPARRRWSPCQRNRAVVASGGPVEQATGRRAGRRRVAALSAGPLKVAAKNLRNPPVEEDHWGGAQV